MAGSQFVSTMAPIFLDADVPIELRGPEMERAANDGLSVVLLSADFATQILSPAEVLRAGAHEIP
jgi:hypothetical protein